MIFSKNKTAIGKLLNDTNVNVSIDEKSNNSINTDNTNNINSIQNKDD